MQEEKRDNYVTDTMLETEKAEEKLVLTMLKNISEDELKERLLEPFAYLNKYGKYQLIKRAFDMERSGDYKVRNRLKE